MGGSPSKNSKVIPLESVLKNTASTVVAKREIDKLLYEDTSNEEVYLHLFQTYNQIEKIRTLIRSNLKEALPDPLTYPENLSIFEKAAKATALCMLKIIRYT
jgi:hypothetical protein